MLQNGNTISQNYPGPKAEVVDPEIDKIAKQIKEVNAKKMVQLKQTVVLSTIQKKLSDSIKKPEVGTTPDWTSVQGHFGWMEIGKELIPYIIRSGEKYVSDRMAKVKLFFQYKMFFVAEIWEYLPIKMLNVTSAEARLLDEINKEHCDLVYGADVFTEKDQIFPAEDAIEGYNFLNLCYSKLTKAEFSEDQRCGFIKINRESLVPYVLVEDKKFVPLFYFEGDCEYLEKYAVELKGWDLVYLKFVCKIQGIRRSLYDKEVVVVVELEYLKKFFVAGTEFEASWDIQNFNKKELLRPATEINNIMVQHNLHPVHPKPAKKVNQPKNYSQMKSVGTNYLPYQKQPYQQYRVNHPAYIPNVNASQQQQQQRVPQRYLTKQPPPNPVMQNSYSTNSVHGNRLMAPTNIPSNRDQGSKIYQIPEVEIRNPLQYFLNRKEINGKILVGCINMEPFNPNNVLVTLEELARSLFQVDLILLKNAINVMCLDIYRPNTEQLNVLRTINISNTEGLILVNNLFENLPQIKYILGFK